MMVWLIVAVMIGAVLWEAPPIVFAILAGFLVASLIYQIERRFDALEAILTKQGERRERETEKVEDALEELMQTIQGEGRKRPWHQG
jgi:hypothetical protein